MANRNNNNSSNFIFIFIAFAMMTGGMPGFVVPLVLFYIFYKMFAGGDKRPRNSNGRSQRRGQTRDYRRRDTDYERPTRETRSTRTTRPTERRPERTTSRRPERTTRSTSRKPVRKSKDNPYKKSGMEKYKEYDYNGAIEDFEKSLAVDDSDVATHFNIACAFSIMENKEKSFYHLSKAVELGFRDFEKIKTHDALAYLRIQDEFETFVQNNYKLKAGSSAQQEKITEHGDLLEQLNKLAELREKGLLTEEEFVLQKKKLLG
ncbi:MAG: SHOCT domain-containing protein [Saprospiraceae bacterium]